MIVLSAKIYCCRVRYCYISIVNERESIHFPVQIVLIFFQELLSDPECYPDLLMRAQELINLLKLPKYDVFFITQISFVLQSLVRQACSVSIVTKATVFSLDCLQGRVGGGGGFCSRA